MVGRKGISTLGPVDNFRIKRGDSDVGQRVVVLHGIGHYIGNGGKVVHCHLAGSLKTISHANRVNAAF